MAESGVYVQTCVDLRHQGKEIEALDAALRGASQKDRLTQLDFLGKVFNKVAIEIAEGRMDPITRRPFARAQPHFQHQHQQRYNNNNNNTQSMNEGPKIPKVNINSMFAAKKGATFTAPTLAVATAAVAAATAVPPPSQPRRSPRKHPQSIWSFACEKETTSFERRRLGRFRNRQNARCRGTSSTNE